MMQKYIGMPMAEIRLTEKYSKGSDRNRKDKENLWQ